MVFIYDSLLFFGASRNVTILLSNEQQHLHKRLTPLSKHKGKHTIVPAMPVCYTK